ncbi:MAG TPA: hypothetical protein VG165_11465 [Solirubrobacteraceae bacterium]|nr:hypothetical protein [Solirubrobacteraceae bacterium]
MGGAVLVLAGRAASGGKSLMDRWVWERLEPWLALRRGLSVGALFCVLR